MCLRNEKNLDAIDFCLYRRAFQVSVAANLECFPGTSRFNKDKQFFLQRNGEKLRLYIA